MADQLSSPTVYTMAVAVSVRFTVAVANALGVAEHTQPVRRRVVGLSLSSSVILSVGKLLLRISGCFRLP